MNSKIGKSILSSSALMLGGVTASVSAMVASPVHNIVLVHGAWINGRVLNRGDL